MLCPARLKYLAYFYGEEEKDPHLPPGVSQGKLLENREQIGPQWSGTTGHQGKKATENHKRASIMMPLLRKQLVNF